MSARGPGTGLALALLAPGWMAFAAEERVHIVQSGETLWHIAATVAGDPGVWPQIYRANRDQIVDPSRLYPGQVLAIPDLEAEAAQPDATRDAASASRD
ncbi:MAG: LysM peptidoglycan-binding domain-containing protein [Myxococcales bacterium]|nr:LysM peptidoglycan-binding domain-containing protein [Myxococcales bacterium]